MEDKKKFIIADVYDDLCNATAIDWNKFPEEVIDNLPGEYLYNVLSVNDLGEVEEKTVVYLKPCKKFKKGVKEFELDNIILGI